MNINKPGYCKHGGGHFSPYSHVRLSREDSVLLTSERNVLVSCEVHALQFGLLMSILHEHKYYLDSIYVPRIFKTTTTKSVCFGGASCETFTGNF